MSKKIFLVALIFFIIGVAGFFTTRAVIIHLAEKKAEEISANTQTSVEIARSIFSRFQKDGYKNNGILARLRPYWSSQHLPSFLRMPSGAIETVIGEGWCDDAARALIYTLAQKNVEAKQWNMATPAGAHVAVVVFEGKTPVLVDPYYGFSTRPMSPDLIRKKMKKGERMERFFTAFGPESRPDFYKDFAEVQMGAQGEPMTISVTLPEKALTVGKVDGSGSDVKGELLQNNLTHVWSYIGHRYDRGWTRELHAKGPVKIEMALTDLPDESVLATLTPRPKVEGKILTWELSRREKITSEDGKAGISWKSYVDIDRIVVTPLAF